MKEAKCAGSLFMTQEGEINWKFFKIVHMSTISITDEQLLSSKY